MDLFQAAILILFGLAISDIIVGVSNDAVNFLNSSVGSRVAPRRVILIIASLGILAGVTFSSGMMEVARKGIFHPQFFTMPELMAIFLAVMLTDIILLDLFNTFGLPTSTTVSIVFELLGAAVAVSLLKLHAEGSPYGDVVNYINTGKALTIIFGILLSLVVAFFSGALIQFVTRMIFTFDFQARLRRYGAAWGGVALSSISYFILIKGSKGASFITPETATWIRENTLLILAMTFAASALALQALISFTRLNILKPIVLAGTFALAMAFAANDLVNFIGVPLAGFSAYKEASASGALLTQPMEALANPVRSNTLFLLAAGLVMVATLWISRKARTVSKTELGLGRQDEGFERFEPNFVSQTIVRIVAAVFKNVSRVVPQRARAAVERRLDRTHYRPTPSADGSTPSFDMLRAGVNLMVASGLIAFATSMKLPLSTTYVTFMVSMGSSLSDQAWGRESAVYRVSGVLTVIGGWFFTALMAFTVSSVFATAIYFGKAPAVIALLLLGIFLIARTRRVHRSREREAQAVEVFNLRKIRDSSAAIDVTFEHTGFFLGEVATVLNTSFEGVFGLDRQKLKTARTGQRRIQQWANVIAANIFKVLRLLTWEDVSNTQRYSQTIGSLQEISESTRDSVMRGYFHVINNHAGLLETQIAELDRIRGHVVEILGKTSRTLLRREPPDVGVIQARNREIQALAYEFDQNQILRIQDNTSKTRLSILFYSLMADCVKIADQTTHLLTIFQGPIHVEGGTQPEDERIPAPTD